jgi:hypothetical protein
MMNVHDQDRESGHSERSEESDSAHLEILRCAQNDIADVDRESSSSRPYDMEDCCTKRDTMPSRLSVTPKDQKTIKRGRFL